MDKKVFYYFIFSFLLLPEVVSADVIFPLSFITLPFFPLIILTEVLVFALYLDFVFKNQPIEVRRMFIGILAANMVTSIIGIFFPLHKTLILALSSAFAFSVLVEWVVYIRIFSALRAIDLFKASFLANLASYTILSGIFSFT